MLTAFWIHVLWLAILFSLIWDSSVYYKPGGFIFAVKIDTQDCNLKTDRRKSLNLTTNMRSENLKGRNRLRVRHRIYLKRHRENGLGLLQIAFDRNKQQSVVNVVIYRRFL
jgi:hypothetical protein